MALRWPVPPLQSALQLESSRVHVMAGNFVMLSLASVLVIQAYRTRVRQPDKPLYALPSWQSQLRAIAVVTVLPTCALALAVLIPPPASAFALVFPLSLIGAVVLGRAIARTPL